MAGALRDFDGLLVVRVLPLLKVSCYLLRRLRLIAASRLTHTYHGDKEFHV